MSALFILIVSFSANIQFGEIQPLEITAFINWFLAHEMPDKKVRLFPITLDISEMEFRDEYDFPEKPNEIKIICGNPIRYEESLLLALKEFDSQINTEFVLGQINMPNRKQRWWDYYGLANVDIVKRANISGYHFSEITYLSRPIFSKNRDLVMLRMMASKHFGTGLEIDQILIYQKAQDSWRLIKEIKREKINPEK